MTDPSPATYGRENVHKIAYNGRKMRMNGFHRAFGQLLSDMRKKRKKTQGEFSIPPRTIRRIERGLSQRSSALGFFQEMKPCHKEAFKWMKLIMELLAPECHKCDSDCQMCNKSFSEFTNELKDHRSLSEFVMERTMLKNLLDLNPYGIAIFDTDGKFVQANQAYLDLFKQPPPPFITIFDSPPLKKAGVQEKILELKTGKIVKLPPFWHNSREVGEEWPDNPICVASVSFPLMDHEDNVHNYVIMFEDITKRVQAEEQLKDALRFKNDFMATISHELRTPLSGIIGSASLVLQDDTLQLPERRVANINNVLANADKLILMINNILDVARINAGTIRISPQYFSLSDVIKETIDPFRKLIEDKSLSIIMDINDDIPLIFNDRHIVGQIVSNLVGNAVKFTDTGKVNITASTDIDDRNKFIIRVGDSGIGIPHDKLQKIFEHFGRVDSSTTRRHYGIGMGLTIVKSYVDLFKGEIDVESREGVGSTFSVKLPIALEHTH